MSIPKELIYVECESLKDLKTILQQAKLWDVKVGVMGGYAVSAYAMGPRGRRFTKDLDFLMTRESLGRLKGLLKSLGYPWQETRFGISGSKSLDEGEIKLHISVDEVYDETSGKSYPISAQLLEEIQKNKLIIQAYTTECSKYNTTAPVIILEDLLIAKLMTLRSKDRVDAVSLLIDRYDDLNGNAFKEKCQHSRLHNHIRSQLNDLHIRVRRRIFDVEWTTETGERMTASLRREIIRRIAKLSELMAA